MLWGEQGEEREELNVRAESNYLANMGERGDREKVLILHSSPLGILLDLEGLRCSCM
jgi:hypothetical protein